MKYSIADLNVEIIGDYNSYCDRRMENYIINQNNLSDITILYRHNDNIILPSGIHFNKTNRKIWIKKQDGSVAVYSKIDLLDNILSLIDFNINYSKAEVQIFDTEPLGGIALNLRAFALMGEAFAHFVLQHNGIVLHSSAISYKNEGILFSAPSGTGKSTHTSLWSKYYSADTIVINDDTPAIRFNKGIPYVYGTPWSGKTEINENIKVPLKAIVFLEQGKNNEIRRLSAAESVASILNETRKPIFSETMAKCLDIINGIITCTPIYKLTCDISQNAVDTVMQTIYL